MVSLPLVSGNFLLRLAREETKSNERSPSCKDDTDHKSNSYTDVRRRSRYCRSRGCNVVHNLCFVLLIVGRTQMRYRQ